jgi:flagellar assembly protein FliH
MQGERAGATAATTTNSIVMQRLAQTVDEIGALRGGLIQKTERQVVQLALAIAARIVHREVATDTELLVAMARVALDRLGDSPAATIRLNPEQHAALTATRRLDRHGAVALVPDPAVAPGGCLVESGYGTMDMSVDAQIEEIAASLLATDAA